MAGDTLRDRLADAVLAVLAAGPRQLTADRLAEIQTMAADYRQRCGRPGAQPCCSAHPVADTVPELLGEVLEIHAVACVQADRITTLEQELEDLRAQNAKTEANFSDTAEEQTERLAAVREVAHDLDDELRDTLGWDWAHAVRDRILAAADGTAGGEGQ
ncbi:hypothetical protein [Thermomonospora amylolytica]|uniref:hypothetical protein n=1 Tax=Thermomonospora amylolytica TaxID=1411117 RepID=UPI000E6C627E|nr:hypothetical protein [Thermomonospora amylolytica]